MYKVQENLIFFAKNPYNCAINNLFWRQQKQVLSWQIHAWQIARILRYPLSNFKSHSGKSTRETTEWRGPCWEWAAASLSLSSPSTFLTRFPSEVVFVVLSPLNLCCFSLSSNVCIHHSIPFHVLYFRAAASSSTGSNSIHICPYRPPTKLKPVLLHPILVPILPQLRHLCCKKRTVQVTIINVLKVFNSWKVRTIAWRVYLVYNMNHFRNAYIRYLRRHLPCIFSR